MTDRPTTKRRILVVDDHQGITGLWKVLLEKTGRYTVQEENHSPQAVRTARVFRPDLMLLDMNMPQLDGCEVAAGVQADDSLAGTPIVFLTSLVTPREVAAGKRIEGYPCLSKPTSVEDLVQVIEEILALPCAA